MAYENTIGILIAAKDEASAVIAKTAAQTKIASGEVNDLGASAGAAGGLIKASLVTALIAGAAESANLAIKFQQDMEVLHTNAGVAQSSLDGLSQAFLNMSSSVGQTPDQLAQAFYHIASAGTGIWSTAQQLDILKASAEGAAIGQANLDDTTYALTSAMSSGIGGVKNAAEMMAVLNAVVGAGDMKLTDLNAALGTGILSTAQAFGISIQSVGTALATLTDNGEGADEASTRLRMTFALMASPSSVAAKQLAALGLTAEDASNATSDMNKVFAESGLTTTKLADDLRQPNGITVAMEDLQSHLENAGLSASETDAMLSKAFGGGRTDAALLTMLGNLDRMNEKFTAINTNAGNFASNYADQQTTAAQQIKNAWDGVIAGFTRVGIFMGQVADIAAKTLAPAFKEVADFWNKYIQPSFDRVIGNNGKQIIEFFGILLAGAIALVVIPLLAMAAGFAYAVVAIDKTVTAVEGFAQALPIAIGQAVTSVTSWWNQLASDTSKWLGGIGSGISDMWSSIVAAFNSGVGAVVGFWTSVGQAFSNGANAAIKWLQNFPYNIGVIVGQVGRVFFDLATQTIPQVVTSIVSWFQRLPAEGGGILVAFSVQVAGFFQRLPGEVEQALSTLWSTVTGWFTKTATDSTKSANDMVTGTTAAVTSLPQRFSDAVAGIWAACVAGFNGFLTNASDWATSTVTAIVNAFASLPGQIGGIISNTWSTATGGVTSFLNDTEKNASNSWSSFVSGVTSGFAHHALGTNIASTDSYIAGENGPELITGAKGTKVSSASDTKKMMGKSNGASVVIQNFHSYNNQDNNRFFRDLGFYLELAS